MKMNRFIQANKITERANVDLLLRTLTFQNVILIEFSSSSQCPPSCCNRGNSQAQQQLKHQYIMAASSQWDAKWSHPRV